MTDPTLFDFDQPTPSVRATDPPTSRKALRELPVSERQREVIQALYAMTGTATADEVKGWLRERRIERERNEVSSRLSELSKPDVGLVQRVGVRKNHRNKTVTTFLLTREGRTLAAYVSERGAA